MDFNSVRSSKGWDALLTALVIVVFAIGAFSFHIQEKVFAYVHAQPGSGGYFGIVFLGWGIWSTTVTAVIVGTLVSMKNYWKAIVISTGSVWLIWSINMAVTKLTHWNVEAFLSALWFMFLLYIPSSILVALCVYLMRKKFS